MKLKINVSTVIEKGGKILFVQEKKKENYKKWNLPGGGLETKEEIVVGALHEVLEEVGLKVTLTFFLGLYPQVGRTTHSFNFVFCGTYRQGNPVPLDNILQCRWMSEKEFKAMSDKDIVSPLKLRRIIKDYFKGVRFPLFVISEI